VSPGPVAQWIEQRTSNPRAEVRFLPGPPSKTWRAEANGAFTRTRLVAFQFYGCGEVEGIPLPPDFCGGRVLLGFLATSFSGEQIDGLYEVNCQNHDPGGQAPPGTSEGVKANARGVNFNKHVTGDNLFVMVP
jgi:hypothetical protein